MHNWFIGCYGFVRNSHCSSETLNLKQCPTLYSLFIYSIHSSVAWAGFITFRSQVDILTFREKQHCKSTWGSSHWFTFPHDEMFLTWWAWAFSEWLHPHSESMKAWWVVWWWSKWCEICMLQISTQLSNYKWLETALFIYKQKEKSFVRMAFIAPVKLQRFVAINSDDLL